MQNKKTITKGFALTLATILATASTPLAFAQEFNIPETTTVAQADSAFPSDVDNLKATAGDSKVTLTWDTATDNVGVTGYKLFYGPNSVTDDGASYTEGPIDLGNVISYEVSGLTNGTTYYFAVTAYDAAGNESEFYSNEAIATPTAGANSTQSTAEDNESPRVVNASATDKNTVKIVFTEKVVLPSTAPETAFNLRADLSGVNLEVLKAELDPKDTSSRTVLLTTADQAEVNYVLTAGLEIKDQAGNPIVSGTSDTAAFMGTTQEAETLNNAPDETDTTAPKFLAVKALSNTEVEVEFSEAVVLKNNAADNFIINETLDPNAIVNIEKVIVAGDNSKMVLTTAPLADKQYNLIALQIMDTAGNEMPITESGTSFRGVVASSENNENTDPVSQVVSQAAKDLLAKSAGQLAAQLTWGVDETKLAEIANFMVYISSDRGATYGEGIRLDKALTSHEFKNLQEGMIYYFKLTSQANNGDESEALITYLTLPKTGPGLALLLLGSAGAGAVLTRRKKQ